MEKEKEKEKKKLTTIRDNELKNLLCYQQAVIIALVNKFCSLTIQKASKDSIITETAPIIIDIIIDGYSIAIRRIAEDLSLNLNKQKDKKKLKEKTIKRRTAKSASAYVNNFLIDILREKGYFFNSKMSKKSNKTYQLERIDAIFFSSLFIMDINHIITCGKVINSYLNNLCKLETKFTLKRNDSNLCKFIQDYHN